MTSRGSALVTGAAHRIGRAIARALAEDGYDLAIHYRTSEEAAGRLVDEVRSFGRKASAFAADLAEPEGIERFVEAVHAEFGAIGVLVNNASFFEPAGWEACDAARLRRELAVHCESPVLLGCAVARRSSDALQAAGRTGSIINLLDWRASLPDSTHFAYSISKGALLAATRNLAVALAPTFTVNGIAPGAILPPSGEDDSMHLPDDLPLPRSGNVEEIVAACRFLVHHATYTTGAVLPVDGGRHLR